MSDKKDCAPVFGEHTLQVVATWLEGEPILKKRFVEISCDRNLSDEQKAHYLKELLQSALGLIDDGPCWNLLIAKGREIQHQDSLAEKQEGKP